MSITVKYFASLREHMGRAEDTLPAESLHTVGDLVALLPEGTTLPDNTLVAINQTYGNMESAVRDGDEVAFFPPVTGG